MVDALTDTFPDIPDETTSGTPKGRHLKRLRRRIDSSMRWRKNEKFDLTWKRMIDMYAGKQFPDATTTEDRIAVNLAWATINIIYPTVSVNRPKVLVLARDAQHQTNAVLTEATVNQWWDQYGVLPEFRAAVKDFLVVGHGWCKVGWRFEEREVDRDPEAIDADFVKAREQADVLASNDPMGAATLPTDDEIRADIPVKEMVTVKDEPFVERVSPFDVFIDPEAKKLSDAEWVAHRIVRTLEDVRNDKRYNPRARRKVKADRAINQELLPDSKRDYGDDVQRVTVWEFYDIKRDQLSVFAHAGDGFLVDPHPIPYESGHPFVMLRNYDVPDRFYPMGDLESMEPLQQELNKTRSDLINARKQHKRKHLYFEDAFDANGRDALEDPTDGVMVPVRKGQWNLSDVIAPMPINPIPPELFNYSAQTEADINTVTGVTEYQRGNPQSVRRTATEAAIIQDSVNARSAEKLAIVEAGIAEVSKRLIELARQFATQGGLLRSRGPKGHPVYTYWEPDDFQAEMDFMVEAGSTVPKGEDYRRQEAMNLMGAIQPFIGPPGSGAPLDAGLIAFWLLEQFGIKDPQRFAAPPPMMPMMPPGAPGGGVPAPSGPPEGGPGPHNNPMAQDPAAAMAAGVQGDPTQGGAMPQVPPEVMAQLAGQVGLNL